MTDDPAHCILDVGGGVSRLASELLGMGYTHGSQGRGHLAYGARLRTAEIGSAAGRVSWIEADIRVHDFRRRYDLWHDRAVFHFMVNAADREGYLGVLAERCEQAAISSLRPSARTSS